LRLKSFDRRLPCVNGARIIDFIGRFRHRRDRDRDQDCQKRANEHKETSDKEDPKMLRAELCRRSTGSHERTVY
jgi:hypothetical protein